jgi:hypothetical protein
VHNKRSNKNGAPRVAAYAPNGMGGVDQEQQTAVAGDVPGERCSWQRSKSKDNQGGDIGGGPRHKGAEASYPPLYTKNNMEDQTESGNKVNEGGDTGGGGAAQRCWALLLPSAN